MYRFLLNGVEILSEPDGWQELTDRRTFDREFNGYLIEMAGALTFTNDGYDIIVASAEADPCIPVELEVQFRESATSVYSAIFNGLIFPLDWERKLERSNKGDVTVEVIDNSFVAKIQNNWQIKAVTSVELSKNQVDISSFFSLETALEMHNLFSGAYAATGRHGISIGNALKMLIAFVTDGKMQVVSDYFLTGSDDLPIYSYLMTGRSIRTGAEDYPYMSLNELLIDINKLFNIAFAIENDANGNVQFRVEQKSYFIQDSNVIDLGEAREVIETFAKDRLYAKVKLGSSELTDPGDMPNLRVLAFLKEEYHLLGECNVDNELDLELATLITDSNTIEDALPAAASGNNNDAHDEKIFLVSFDNALQSIPYHYDESLAGMPPYNYNEFYINSKVLERWLDGIPNSVAIFLGDGNDEFRASLTSDVALNTQIFIVGTSYAIVFDDDSTPPNFDPNGNYNVANGRFVAPSSGVFSFKTLIKATNNNAGTSGLLEVRLFHRDAALAGIQSNLIGFLYQGIETKDIELLFENVYMNTGDVMRVEVTTTGTLNPVGIDILENSFFECTYTFTGGGIVKFSDIEEKNIKLYEMSIPMDSSTFNEFDANPFSKFRFQTGKKFYEGRLESIERNRSTGMADVKLITRLS